MFTGAVAMPMVMPIQQVPKHELRDAEGEARVGQREGVQGKAWSRRPSQAAGNFAKRLKGIEQERSRREQRHIPRRPPPRRRRGRSSRPSALAIQQLRVAAGYRYS